MDAKVGLALFPGGVLEAREAGSALGWGLGLGVELGQEVFGFVAEVESCGEVQLAIGERDLSLQADGAMFGAHGNVLNQRMS